MTDYDSLATAARRDRRRMLVGFSAVSLVLLLVLGLGWADAATGRNIWRTQALDTQTEYDQLLAEYTSLYGEYIDSTGEEPTAESPTDVAQEGPRGATGAQGAPGPVGPAGVPGPVGPSGVDGEDGPTGAAGPVGPPGPDGTVGATGSAGANGVDGAPGQTGAAGAAGPAGPVGATGPQGPAGADGRGIASLVCDDAGRWQVTYTDGTTADAGACRTDPTPAPEPDPIIPLLP